ncbi:SDR family NAD(P)-dependent oxidoreductase [Phreatobacter stygius]|uniref:SDR family oxidoreductase n=1 Tax=Phreatobacter stygius TaxID=1940610 RepID=A0A4D7B7D0_9HYPH|nr:SDR family oxidoreductase [Phreatobacter stygius]QCI66803.1 SDR family oxidoreductase [Phreatobacter stygius]
MTASPEVRVAIVTGGASGIGLATAGILLEQGWQVVGTDRDADALAAAETALAGHAGRFRMVQGDVTDEAAMARLVEETERDVGPIRGLVTSAGIGRDVPFLDTTADMFRTIHEINVVGTFIIARAAAAAMRASGGGAIVTIASVSGLTGNIGRAAYGSSKGAIVNLTRIMAVELARFGIRVNSVAPGPIETPMVAEVHTSAIRDQWNDKVLLERYGTPAEIGEAVAFLVDARRSSYITGQILAVDGGFVACGLNDKSRG